MPQTHPYNTGDYPPPYASLPAYSSPAHVTGVHPNTLGSGQETNTGVGQPLAGATVNQQEKVEY